MNRINFIAAALFLLMFAGMLSCSNTSPMLIPEEAQPASTPIPIQFEPHSKILPSTPLPAATPYSIIIEPSKKINQSDKLPDSFPLPTQDPIEPLVQEFPLTVIDRDGNEMTFNEPPTRIIAYDAAAIETIFAIGQKDRLIGTHSWVSYPKEVANIEKVGDAFNMDIERIIELQPDLVFLFYPTFKEELEKVGLKVLLLESVDDDLTKMADTFRTWGQITDAVEEAESLARDFEARVDSIQSTLSSYHSGPSVFQDVGDLWTPGNNTLMGSVFKLLKLENIAGDVENYGQISPEVLIDRNPQFIISSDPNSFYENTIYRDLLPVKNNSIFKPNDDYLGISGPRFILGVEELATKLYPGIFH